MYDAACLLCGAATSAAWYNMSATLNLENHARCIKYWSMDFCSNFVLDRVGFGLKSVLHRRDIQNHPYMYMFHIREKGTNILGTFHLSTAPYMLYGKPGKLRKTRKTMENPEYLHLYGKLQKTVVFSVFRSFPCYP